MFREPGSLAEEIPAPLARMWEVFLEEVPFELSPAGQLSRQARPGPMDEGIAKVSLSFAKGQREGWEVGTGILAKATGAAQIQVSPGLSHLSVKWK